jgi:hypothetical protein
MHVQPRSQQTTLVPIVLLTCALAYLTVHQVAGTPPLGLPIATLAALAALIAARPVVPWRLALLALVLVILFIPIRRYVMPGDMPFQLEPYRLLVAILLLGWTASLLVDPRVRARRSGFEGPMAAILLAAILSDAANAGQAMAFQSEVIKALTFFASFVLVYYLLVGVVRSGRDIDVLLKGLVGGGALLGLLAVYESRTGSNVFNNLPILRLDPRFTLFSADTRGAQIRAYGSAEHPIALSAVLVMLIPLSLHLRRSTGRLRWLAAGAVLAAGALSTQSRTGVLMLFVVVVAYLCLRRRETMRYWPALLPLLVGVHIALPGTLGTLHATFFPEEGLVAQQKGDERFGCGGAGRIGKLGPALDELKRKPLFGLGYGTRVVSGPDPNACVQDNQWLTTALETGLVGVVAWLWLVGRFLRRLGGEARRDRSERGSLLTALCASLAAFAVGMLTFDGLGFIQATFVLFMILALSAVTLGVNPRAARASPGRAAAAP